MAQGRRPRKLFERLHGVAGAIVAVAAGVTTILGLVFLVLPWLKPQPPQAPPPPPAKVGGTLGLRKFVPKMSARSYLLLSGRPTTDVPDKQLRQLGNLIEVRVDVLGGRHTLLWSVHRKGEETPIENPQFSGHGDVAKETAGEVQYLTKLWVPIPPPPGEFFARIVLETAAGTELDSIDTQLFQPVERPQGGAPPRLAPLTCGVERWDVKTLQDAAATRVDFRPQATTVGALARLPNPGRSLQRAAPYEFRTYAVPVRLVSYKAEIDADIKLVVADPRTGATMIAELPNVACADGAKPQAKAKMSRARADLIAACGEARPSYVSLSGTAVITGVAYFGFKHGQLGVARNAIELHPLVGFRSSSCRSP